MLFRQSISAFFTALALTALAFVSPVTAGGVVLSGKVSSAEEGSMEGVIVSAKKGIFPVSVVSNDKGEFSFPADKLQPGDYALTIKAGGYDLDGPKTVTLSEKPQAI